MTLQLNLTPTKFKLIKDIRGELYAYKSVDANFPTVKFNQLRNQIIDATGITNHTGWKIYRQPVADEGFIDGVTAQRIIDKVATIEGHLSPEVYTLLDKWLQPAADHQVTAYWKA